jgi:hypothetical protein
VGAGTKEYRFVANPFRRWWLQRDRMVLRVVLFVLGGAAIGFAYQRLVGCRSGACLITSNPYVSTLYGAFIGYLASGGVR